MKNPKVLSVWWILVLAFGVGMVYLFLLPPWQQNDEPTQFEYVWLVAHLNHWPQPGDYDNQVRREIAASMLEHRFYHTNGGSPSLIDVRQINIGVSQLSSFSLYYLLASLPLRLIPNTDITFQLYLTRFVSLALFILTVYFAYEASRVIFGETKMALVLTLFISLLPQLAYRMTAVNDDAAAVAAMTFFMWKSLKGIKCGGNWKIELEILAGIGLCLLAKPTAWLALPLGVLALLLSFFHQHQGKIWLAYCVVVIGTFTTILDWKASLPAYYYQRGGQPQRVYSEQAVDGKHIFANDKRHAQFFQVLDRKKLVQWVEEGYSKVSIGAWGWATQPIEVPFLQLRVDGEIISEPIRIKLTPTPMFFTAQGNLPKNFRIAVIQVNPGNLPEGTEVFWDCLVLIPGEAKSLFPQVGESCQSVQWGNYYGENAIRNASAEQGWFPLRPFITKLLANHYGKNVTDFWAVFDPATSHIYFRDALGYLFRTFWGRFNWGTLPLAGRKPYRLFVVLTIIAVTGLPIAIRRYRASISWSLIGFLSVSFVAGLLYTLFRYAGDWDNYYLLLPQARYFFPYVLPSAFLLCSGWWGWASWVLGSKRAKSLAFVLFILMMLAYNGWAWYTIWHFWYG